MTQWEEIRRRPVLPFYLAALVWPVAGLLLPLYQLWALALTVVCSAAVGLVAARLCPARIVRREVPYTTGSEDADAMIAGITADLDRLRALNLDIPDKDLSALMDRMEKAGRGIVSELQHDPDKAKQVDRFARYYLPEARKILAAYARMQDVDGKNAGQIKQEVLDTAGTIAKAFENQLDALYGAEALDLSTDIDVLETILKSQNLAEEQFAKKKGKNTMAEQNMTPDLELNVPAAPSLTLEADAPTLTLDPAADEKVVEEAKKAAPVKVEDTPLSPEEQQMVDDFAEKIDITNSQMVLQYGAASQKKLSDFSDTALSRVKTKDMGETGELITDLIGELQGFDATEESKGIFGFFKRQQANLENLKTKYEKADVNVERIKAKLEDHQVTLMKDITMLDKMYQLNLVYFKELTMYILAGRKKLADVRAKDLAEAQAKAQRTQLPEDAQAARDMADMCDRFEKKLHDLELTRNVSIQMGPQIRLIQSNDTMMAEKIQTTIVNTIPLWKNQMVLALGMAHSQQAMQAERAVTDATNELLLKNAATLKQGTIDIARESERGVVDIETLKKTNQELISTLDELNKIRADGKAKRAAAEQELGRIEGELRAKLLELNQ